MAFAMDNLVITLTPTLICNSPFADADGDGDVDQADFAAFQRCITGTDDPGSVYNADNCACFDRDFDSDIDQSDLLAFEACVSGPNVPADPGCGQ
jgi:hypothetical protein